MVTRIPLDIVVTETGATTSGKVVAVMVADIDALEMAYGQLSERLVVTRTALTEIAHHSPGSETARIARKALEAQ